MEDYEDVVDDGHSSDCAEPDRNPAPVAAKKRKTKKQKKDPNAPKRSATLSDAHATVVCPMAKQRRGATLPSMGQNENHCAFLGSSVCECVWCVALQCVLSNCLTVGGRLPFTGPSLPSSCT